MAVPPAVPQSAPVSADPGCLSLSKPPISHLHHITAAAAQSERDRKRVHQVSHISRADSRQRGTAGTRKTRGRERRTHKRHPQLYHLLHTLSRPLHNPKRKKEPRTHTRSGSDLPLLSTHHRLPPPRFPRRLQHIVFTSIYSLPHTAPFIYTPNPPPPPLSIPPSPTCTNWHHPSVPKGHCRSQHFGLIFFDRHTHRSTDVHTFSERVPLRRRRYSGRKTNASFSRTAAPGVARLQLGE